MTITIEEVWKTIPDFPNYKISSFGRVYNSRFDMYMSISRNNFGHMKINLTDDWGRRHTRSVALMVAEAFVPRPNNRCDHVLLLDGDHENVEADNLVWRPRGFTWIYDRQLRTEQPRQYENLLVRNKTEGILYPSIVAAGMSEGLLFEDIWKSTWLSTEDNPHPVFPTGAVFEIVADQ